MSTEDLERRVSKLEDSHDDLEQSIIQLNTTIALLNQTVETMAKNEEKRQQLRDRSFLFIIGGLISSVMAWIIRGGLGQ
jgi:septal ring factor EnvC (AmiA/AmiB activator)